MATTTPPKAYRGLGMEGWFARWYTANMRRAIEEYQALARRIAAELPPGARALDVAPGPGFFAIELAKLGDYRVAGLDISRTFVEIARQNAAGADVDFRLGNASNMPFDDETFDFLVCRAAFKNFADPLGALNEMHRVLKPGGKALIIDLRRDAPQKTINRHVDGMGVTRLNALWIKLTFRFMLLKRAYTANELKQLASETKFRRIDVVEDDIGLELSLSK